MSFTVVWTGPGGNTITSTGVRSVDIAPNNDRSQPAMIRLNGGIGGGGIAGAGATLVPAANVTSITLVL